MYACYFGYWRKRTVRKETYVSVFRESVEESQAMMVGICARSVLFHVYIIFSLVFCCCSLRDTNEIQTVKNT